MFSKQVLITIQSRWKREEWYKEVTDAALYMGIGGFPDEANRLLEGLWKYKLPHDRDTWLPDRAFEVLWDAAGKRPGNAPFSKTNIDELELLHRDYLVLPAWASQPQFSDNTNPLTRAMVLAATKNGKFPGKEIEEEALHNYQLYFENIEELQPHPYELCKALSIATELAARNGREDFAVEILKQWANRFYKYPYNNAVVLVGCNRHVAPLLLKGVIADELGLSKEVCNTFVNEALAAIDNRMKNGISLAYGSMNWHELLSKLSGLSIKHESEAFSEKQKKETWIGKKPADLSAINQTEKRLGMQLPHDYKDFLKVSNGLSSFSIIQPDLLPIEEIDFLKNIYFKVYGDYEIFEITKTYPGEEGEDFGSLVESAIVISSLPGGSEVWLIPPNSNNSEWQCWEFSASNPGEYRYKGFRYFIEQHIQYLEEEQI